VLELVVRVFFSLLVVFGLMWGMAKLARRPLGGRGAGAMTVLSRTQLTRTASMAVVKVADKALIIGVTDASVTLLSETDLQAFEMAIEAPAIKEPLTEEQLNGIPRRTPGFAVNGGVLAGSALSPQTWRQALRTLRERTVRK